MAGERERCLAIGMDGYLSKPFTAADLRGLIASTANHAAPTMVAGTHHADAPLDAGTIHSLREECRDGDEDYFSRYVTFFREDAAQALASFAAGEKSTDAELLRRTAHHLRGTAANFGAHPLIALCYLVEKHAIAGEVSEALTLLPALREELARVETALETELSGH
jgi:HPt (histidine-containing phosphotransfer) domain-containing protein